MLLVWFVERSEDGEHHEVDGGEEERGVSVTRQSTPRPHA
jgi:hypothetical protein